MKYLVDDNQLPMTFRTVFFEELISEQTRLSVSVLIQERSLDPSLPEILFSERNVGRTRESSGNRAYRPQNFREQIKFN